MVLLTYRLDGASLCPVHTELPSLESAQWAMLAYGVWQSPVPAFKCRPTLSHPRKLNRGTQEAAGARAWKTKRTGSACGPRNSLLLGRQSWA